MDRCSECGRRMGIAAIPAKEMTIRDVFAAVAMERSHRYSCLRGDDRRKAIRADADSAYEMADAMIAARK